jgi:hypothetical protein
MGPPRRGGLIIFGVLAARVVVGHRWTAGPTADRTTGLLPTQCRMGGGHRNALVDDSLETILSPRRKESGHRSVLPNQICCFGWIQGFLLNVGSAPALARKSRTERDLLPSLPAVHHQNGPGCPRPLDGTEQRWEHPRHDRDEVSRQSPIQNEACHSTNFNLNFGSRSLSVVRNFLVR